MEMIKLNTCPKCGEGFDSPAEFIGHVTGCRAKRAEMQKPERRSKFNNKRTEYNGVTYDSILEASYAEHLDKLKSMEDGTLMYWLRQVPFDLPGGVKYRVDFMAVYNVPFEGYEIEYIDVKGRETAMFKLKKKQVEALYPVEIKTVKKGEF